MIYYSTGKSPYLPAKGKAVECTNTTTVEILLKKGALVVSLTELDVIETKELETIEVEKENLEKPIIEKQKVVAKPKTKGRPKKTK